MNVMSDGGDIQRGDRVYYRGDVWTVNDARTTALNQILFVLSKDGGLPIHVYSLRNHLSVQRVESIR